MRTIKGIIAVVLLLAVPRTLDAKTQGLNATTPSNVPSTSITCLGTDTNSYGSFAAANAVSLAYNTFNTGGVFLTVYSVAGSVATVAIETGETTSGPWFPVTGSSPITNPTQLDSYGVGGETWYVPPDTNVRIHLTAWTSGVVKFCLSGKNPVNGTQVY